MPGDCDTGWVRMIWLLVLWSCGTGCSGDDVVAVVVVVRHVVVGGDVIVDVVVVR